MATKTKRARIDRTYAPKEIREDAKARKAWLAAKKAEIDATPGLEGQIVDSGSYQNVVTWKLTEVAAKVQVRGTCQFCGGNQAVVNGFIADHGYERPGWGFNVGQCRGQRNKPAEHDVALAKGWLTMLRDQVAGAEKRKAEMEKENPGLERNYYHLKDETCKTYRDLRSLIFHNKAHADHIEGHVIPQFGKALKEVLK